MADYRFVTRWHLAAPIETVYGALSEPPAWPHWWPGLVAVELLATGDGEGRGRRYRYLWRSALGYRLRFEVNVTRVEQPRLIEALASGDLEGIGRWELEGSATGTRVTHLWRVRTTPPWMNLSAPLTRPFFAWSHHRLMRRGALGLARHLAAPLVGPVEMSG
ncbi:SRPBCC family protein [Halomonas ramblicola]|uniref:SRPBCC family protein n=1 Tax=Halomonas ramblicola TaxID=747349 RepID=UPI0025B2A41D|nr:SRPBCC family protein [Halomonas ramblicola]MDN3520662.1 SRPBCC family protein [Halomonas ramblicola]